VIENLVSQNYHPLKTLLPLNHFLLLCLIGKYSGGIEFHLIQKNLQRLNSDHLRILGLNRSDNALYHVLSRMIKQGLLISQNQGFQQPGKYVVTPIGQKYLRLTWNCVKIWQLQPDLLCDSPLNQLEEVNTENKIQSKQTLYAVPKVVPRENQEIHKRWLNIMEETWYSNVIKIPKEVKARFIRFAKNNIPLLMKQNDAIIRQDLLETALINEFNDPKKFPLDSESLRNLITSLDQTLFLKE